MQQIGLRDAKNKKIIKIFSKKKKTPGATKYINSI